VELARQHSSRWWPKLCAAVAYDPVFTRTHKNIIRLVFNDNFVKIETGKVTNAS